MWSLEWLSFIWWGRTLSPPLFGGDTAFWLPGSKFNILTAQAIYAAFLVPTRSYCMIVLESSVDKGWAELWNGWVVRYMAGLWDGWVVRWLGCLLCSQQLICLSNFKPLCATGWAVNSHEAHSLLKLHSRNSSVIGLSKLSPSSLSEVNSCSSCLWF